MGKIKAFFRNKWVGFTLASILYIPVSYTHLTLPTKLEV